MPSSNNNNYYQYTFGPPKNLHLISNIQQPVCNSASKLLLSTLLPAVSLWGKI